MEAPSADLIFSTDWNPLPVAAAYQTSQETGSAFPQLDLVRESRHDMTSPRAVRARLSHALFIETRTAGSSAAAALDLEALLRASGAFTVMWLVDGDFV